MDEVENFVESLEDKINERGREPESPWMAKAALTSAFLAVFAALASLMAGHYANEAMINQIQASDSWAYYQSKGIKAELLQTRTDILASLGKKVDPSLIDKLSEYNREKAEIAAQAREHERDSKGHFGKHEVLARAVTFFQIAIAMVAIGLLTRRRSFWHLSMGCGAMGILSFLISTLGY